MSKTSQNSHAMVVPLMIAAFLSSLGQSLMTASVPQISQAFNISEAQGEWLTMGYILILGIVSAFTAFLINRIPTRPLFLTTMCLFTVGIVISLVAPSFPLLLVGRLIQGVGAGVMLPLTQVVLMNSYPSSQQGAAFAVMGIVLAFAPAIGPTIAGVLSDHFGFRSIFILMLVIGLVALLMGVRMVHNVGKTTTESLDVISAILYSIGFAVLMIGVSETQVVEMLIGLVLLVVFGIRQFRVPSPFLQLRVFKSRRFTVTMTLIVVGYAVNMTDVMLVPLMLQSALGYSATIAGLAMLPGALCNLVANPLGGWLLDHKGARVVGILGTASVALGASGLAFVLHANSPLWLAAVGYILLSFGMSLIMTPLVPYAVSELSVKEMSHGNAIIVSGRQMLGTIVGTALVAVTAQVSPGKETTIAGINVAYAILMVIALLGLAIAVTLLKNQRMDEEAL
ncbi:DHA2 family efflux MFS transporter permease subunit [Lacticaseibacillus camelliae]|nr:DHA2 family efflux MFS transporter permease subunit [Lacticaseibacillus camelliae]